MLTASSCLYKYQLKMLFRLGGLFLLCVISAFSLRNVWPFSAVSKGAGTLAVVAIYLAIAVFSVRTKNRNRLGDDGRGKYQMNLGPWPVHRSRHVVLIQSLLFGGAAISFICARIFNSSEIGTVAAFLALFLLGLSMLALPLNMLRFGYFPSGRYRGVSRESEPLQFWATLGMYVLFGGGCIYGAVAAMWQGNLHVLARLFNIPLN
jgi:hypothetical protein